MKRVVPGVNGVKGVPGIQGGFMVATYNGVPIIPSKDVKKDGSSRMYFLDTDYSWFTTAKPTLYHESGIETGDPFGINRLGQMGMFHTMGELICILLQGKRKDSGLELRLNQKKIGDDEKWQIQTLQELEQ